MQTGSASSRDIVLRASSLGLRFGAVDALKEVSIVVAAGEIHAIIGPNGAGKRACSIAFRASTGPSTVR